MERGFGEGNALGMCVATLCPETVTESGQGEVSPPLTTFWNLTPGSGTSVSLFLGNLPGWADTAELSGVPVLKNSENL